MKKKKGKHFKTISRMAGLFVFSLGLFAGPRTGAELTLRDLRPEQDSTAKYRLVGTSTTAGRAPASTGANRAPASQGEMMMYHQHSPRPVFMIDHQVPRAAEFRVIGVCRNNNGLIIDSTQPAYSNCIEGNSGAPVGTVSGNQRWGAFGIFVR